MTTAPSARAEQARSQQRHERILDAALRVFTRQGYRDAAMDDIAAESGTSKGGVYFHFPSKQSVLLALLDRAARLLRSRAEEAIAAQEDPIGKLDAALHVVLGTFASHRTLARLFLVETPGAGREFSAQVAAIHDSFAALIQAQLDDAVRQGIIAPLDTTVAGRAWFGALNEVVTAWVLAEPPGRLEETYPTLRRLLLSSVGIAPDRTAPAGPATDVRP